MRERELQDLLISILRAELTESEVPKEVKSKLDAETISALYRLSKAHDLAHIVADALERPGLLGNDEISEKYRKQAMLSVLRCERIKYELGEICATLDKANIPYIPLKGSVIRDYYPKDSMRTSCDIDVLVREETLCQVIDLICTELNYTKDVQSEYDVVLISQAGLHLEVHFALCEGDKKIDDVLSCVWEHVHLKSGSRYAMKDDFFLFYHLTHMAKHFNSGGCGIRPFMDLMVIEHYMKINRHCADELLQVARLSKFAEGAYALTDSWFASTESTELTRSMQDYIMKAGVYGTLENSIAMRRKKKSKLSYIICRIFLPYGKMVVIFPSLKRAPILLPIYYIIRPFRMIKQGRFQERINEAKINDSITDEQIEFVRSLTEQLGL